MRRAIYILSFCVPFAFVGLLLNAQDGRLFTPYVVLTLTALEILVRYISRHRTMEWKNGMEVVWFPYQTFLIYLLGKDLSAGTASLLLGALAASAMISLGFWSARYLKFDAASKASD